MWLKLERLTTLGFPRRFPIVQFPNLPLVVGLLAAGMASLLHGDARFYARSISYLAIAIWAYGELAHGVNWFRRLLGAAFVALTVVGVAHGLQA